jgi:hypothetical protein
MFQLSHLMHPALAPPSWSPLPLHHCDLHDIGSKQHEAATQPLQDYLGQEQQAITSKSQQLTRLCQWAAAHAGYFKRAQL